MACSMLPRWLGAKFGLKYDDSTPRALGPFLVFQSVICTQPWRQRDVSKPQMDKFLTDSYTLMFYQQHQASNLVYISQGKSKLKGK